MILSKNPKGKTEANEVKTLMLNKQFSNIRQGVDNRWNQNKTDIVTIKTSKGEYSHPIDMNIEMAKRFEALERQCNITDGGSHTSNKRSKSLQEMYIRYKSMPKDDVKKELKKFKGSPWHYDNVYVIETLLKIK